jgi:hypothetical protein
MTTTTALTSCRGNTHYFMFAGGNVPDGWKCECGLATFGEMKLPDPNVDVLIFSPDWSEKWWFGWVQGDGKWYVDPKDEPCRCLTDEGCKVVKWVPLPPIPEPWATLEKTCTYR